MYISGRFTVFCLWDNYWCLPKVHDPYIVSIFSIGHLQFLNFACDHPFLFNAKCPPCFLFSFQSFFLFSHHSDVLVSFLFLSRCRRAVFNLIMLHFPSSFQSIFKWRSFLSAFCVFFFFFSNFNFWFVSCSSFCKVSSELVTRMSLVPTYSFVIDFELWFSFSSSSCSRWVGIFSLLYDMSHTYDCMTYRLYLRIWNFWNKSTKALFC